MIALAPPPGPRGHPSEAIVPPLRKVPVRHRAASLTTAERLARLRSRERTGPRRVAAPATRPAGRSGRHRRPGPTGQRPALATAGMIAVPTLLLSGLTAASPAPLAGEDELRLASTALSGSQAGLPPEPGVGGPDLAPGLGPDAGRSALSGGPAVQVLEAERLLADRAAAAQVAAEQAARDAAARAEAERPRFVTPVEAPAGSPYGPRWGRLHAGLDFPAPIDTPIRAVADGVVEQAGPASGYGNLVTVVHEDGTVTAYGHMRVISVAPGQPVQAGQTIALVGNEGRSTGPHLHLEVRVDGGAVDPRPWLAARGVAV